MCMIFCYLRFCVLKSIMGEGTIYHKVLSVGGGEVSRKESKIHAKSIILIK